MAQVATVNEAFLLVTGRGDKVGWKWLDSGTSSASAEFTEVRRVATFRQRAASGKGLHPWRCMAACAR